MTQAIGYRREDIYERQKCQMKCECIGLTGVENLRETDAATWKLRSVLRAAGVIDHGIELE